VKPITAIFGILAGVAIVNIVLFSKNTPAVTNAVFGGASNLFGSLTTNRG